MILVEFEYIDEQARVQRILSVNTRKSRDQIYMLYRNYVKSNFEEPYKKLHPDCVDRRGNFKGSHYMKAVKGVPLFLEWLHINFKVKELKWEEL